MANAIKPQGAKPYGQVLRLTRYVAGGTIYPNDILKLNGSGQVVVTTAGTNAAVGVAASYATSGLDVLVWDHPDQQFVIQSSGSLPGALTDFNLNYDIVATAGNSTYRASRMALDGSASQSGATYPLKALDYDRRADNALSANCDVIVVINNHVLKGGTGTAGV